MSQKHVAIYVRVSSSAQNMRSQLPDLKRWVDACDQPVKWYRDTASGKSMDRPAWRKLDAAITAGQVTKIVCWRLDRLGRTAKGLTALIADLQERRVGLVSLREGLDLNTPAGRLMCHILASIAEYETEIRGERVKAGQAAARAAGKRWGGSEKGRRTKVTDLQIRTIRELKAEGTPIAAIARTLSLSRPTVYSVLGANGEA
jgi:DNA invertase Pin-like site-specific DNA recombinase